MGAVNEQYPWPIKNALLCLKEVADRENGPGERAATIQATIAYAVEVVKGINSMKEPEPPSPDAVAKRAVREFVGGLADQVELLSTRLRAIADGEDEPFGDFGL